MSAGLHGNGIYVSLEELVDLRKSGLALRNAVAQIVSSDSAGALRSRIRGQGLEFDELRPYQPGDDVRSIDWRVTARSGRTITKLFTEDREQQYLFAVDQTPSMFFGSSVKFKSVTAAHCTALLAWAALANGARVGGVVAGERLSMVRDKADRRAVLQLLECVTTANQQLQVRSESNLSLGDILHQCLQRARSGARVIVVSDFESIDEDAGLLLAALCRRANVLLVRVSDPLQEQLLVTGRVGIGNGRQSAHVNINAATRRGFVRLMQQAHTKLTSLAGQHHATLIQVSTDHELFDQLNAVPGHNGASAGG